MAKTKEMKDDLRKNPTVVSPVVISDQAVECVHKYNYPGNIIDEKLTFERHVDAVLKKKSIFF